MSEQAELAFDPTAPLAASGNLARRNRINTIAEWGAKGAAALAIAVLAIIVGSVAVRGAGVLSWKFVSTDPDLFGGVSGGIKAYIIGSALIVAVATVIATPLGILVAVYLTEYASGRPARVVRLALDLVNGLPSIVVAVFVFGLMVVNHHQSGFAVALALAIIMLPLIARSTQELLAVVPQALRDGADALGVARWRAVLTIIIPSALSGIVTGVVLAIARAAGETAPPILLSSVFADKTSLDIFGVALPNIPVAIFTLSQQADAGGLRHAWGAAFVLLLFILLTNIVARAIAARSARKLGQ